MLGVKLMRFPRAGRANYVNRALLSSSLSRTPPATETPSVRRSQVSACNRRYKSTAPAAEEPESTSSHHATTPSGRGILSTDASEMISFPTVDGEGKPVLLNAQEHAVGYLSKILNARVYDAARETELQHAKNLSAVCYSKS